MAECGGIFMAAGTTADNQTIWGHPKGLFFLAMTEAWERFSFYGMRALLVLYLVQELLLPGHIENVAGMPAFRAVVEDIFGPMSTQAFASQTFGIYAGFVYFTPLFGGLIADRWLGARKTVLLGIVLMTAGHFFMAFEWAVLLALLLLILGSGCLKGNIAAQVGHLYPKDDEALRSRGYTIFSTGINIGATIGPLLCGLLAQIYGWHVGFGTAGVFMLFAAMVYIAGMKHFAAERARGKNARQQKQKLTAADWQIVGLIGVVLLIGLAQSLAYEQLFNVGMIWVSDKVLLATSFGQVPVAWFASEDSLASVLCVPLLIGLWRWQAKRGREPGDLGKIAIGGVLMALAQTSLAIGDVVAGEGKALLLFPVIAFCLSGISFMYMWPTTLALVSRRAPASINAVMMAVTYMTGFASGIGSGFIARWYEPLGGANFWMLNALIAIAGSVCVVLFGKRLTQRMDELEADGGVLAVAVPA